MDVKRRGREPGACVKFQATEAKSIKDTYWKRAFVDTYEWGNYKCNAEDAEWL